MKQTAETSNVSITLNLHLQTQNWRKRWRKADLRRESSGISAMIADGERWGGGTCHNHFHLITFENSLQPQFISKQRIALLSLIGSYQWRFLHFYFFIWGKIVCGFNYFESHITFHLFGLNFGPTQVEVFFFVKRSWSWKWLLELKTFISQFFVDMVFPQYFFLYLLIGLYLFGKKNFL